METEIIVKWNVQEEKYVCSVPEYAAELERALKKPHDWQPPELPWSEVAWEQKSFPLEYLPILVLSDDEKQEFRIRSSAFPYIEMRSKILDEALQLLHTQVDVMLAWRQRIKESAGQSYRDDETEERVSIPEDVDEYVCRGWSREQLGLFDWLTRLREGKVMIPML